MRGATTGGPWSGIDPRWLWDGIDACGPGPVLVALPRRTHAGSGVDGVAAAARAHGFQVIDAATGPATDAPRRHVALVVRRGRDRALAADWLKALARASPRLHLVFVPVPARTQWGCVDAPGQSSRSRADDCRLAALIAAGRFDLAEAWLAALRLEAWLRGVGCRARTLALGAWLRVRQARHEEAVGLCDAMSPGALRRSVGQLVDWASGRSHRTRAVARGTARRLGATRQALDDLWRSKQEATTMFVLHAIPTVLQLVADADDEQVALRAAAAWARTHAGAHRVAFVGGDEARVIAADGWGSAMPSGDERMRTLRAHEVAREVQGALVSVTAPVRYAGAPVGGLLIVGPRDRAETMAEAAVMLAALCAPALRSRLDTIARTRDGAAQLPEMIGRSPAMAALREAVSRAAGTPFPVLVEGESGTGKELVARALHRLSPRRDRRFAPLNCAALADELAEAELFGHTRGAFTGAVAPRAGLFEDAHGGTVFLDEVAELSPRAQAKLLRVLQEREVRRMGENTTRAIDVRIVAATNRPLAEAAAQAQFRHDLLFRLAVVRLRLPPLRERTEDIAPLALAFWQRATGDVGKRAVLGADALARLAAHRWPGNVRELQNVMAGLSVLAPVRGRVGARHVEQVLADAGGAARMAPMSLERARWWCEQQTIAAALARHGGRRAAAARELGLTRQGLTKAMRRLRIQEPRAEGVA